MSKFPKRTRSEAFIGPDGILRCIQIAVENRENLERTEKMWKEIFSSSHPPKKVLFDQRGVNFLSQIPFRQTYIRMTAIAKSVKKAALLTDNRLLWIFLSFNFNAGKNMKEAAMSVKPFLSEEKALQWLKQD